MICIKSWRSICLGMNVSLNEYWLHENNLNGLDCPAVIANFRICCGSIYSREDVITIRCSLLLSCRSQDCRVCESDACVDVC